MTRGAQYPELLAAFDNAVTAYRIVFEENPNPVWVVSPEALSFIAVNDAAVIHGGYSRTELARLRVTDLFPPEDAAQIVVELGTAHPGQRTFGQYRQLRKGGAVLHVETVSHDITVGGERARLVAIVDVTERVAFQAQLRQAQKMGALGQLTGSVAHDFNNLLTVITNAGELALDQMRADDAARPDVETICRAASRAGELTSQLLAVARKRPPQPEVLDLGALVAGPREMLRRLIGRRIELVVRTDEALGAVRADAPQVEQVLLNLAVNARDAMPRGGTLEVATTNQTVTAATCAAHPGLTPGEYVALVVRDTGVGMDAATLARVFEPFFTTKPAGGGSGLGLSTVHGIVKQWGGHVYAESTPGTGTTFTVLLPRVPATADAATGAALGGEAGDDTLVGTETVLVAEPDAAVRAVARRILEQRGYSVIEAATAGEAMAAAQRWEASGGGPVQLVVVEATLPDASGAGVVQRLRATNPALPAVLLAAAGPNAAAPGELENASLLYKPFAPRALARQVRALLDGAAAAGAR